MAAAKCSPFAQAFAASRGIRLQASDAATRDGEKQLWRACVSWGVNPMPCRLIAVDVATNAVVGASYYNLQQPAAFLSALAVLPSHRGQRIGKLLIAASVTHMLTENCTASSLHVLSCDASPARHALYASCGFEGGTANGGGNYTLAKIPADYEQLVLTAAPHAK
jgi:GNAT superfamily N-acetyltransferase